MSVLYLMRHGQASFGSSNYDRLSDLGRRQSVVTGQYLERLGMHFDAAYSGAMARQRDTAQAVFDQLSDPPDLRITKCFNEYDSGPIISALAPLMGREDPAISQAIDRMFEDRRSFQLVYEGAMRRWIAGDCDVKGAETWRSFLERVESGLGEVRADQQGGKKVLLFTSGGPISAVMRRALRLPDQSALEVTWLIKNASVSSFLFDRRNISLSTFNCTAHLDERGEPVLITYR